MNRKKLTRLISVVLLIVIIDGIRVNKNKIKTMLPGSSQIYFIKTMNKMDDLVNLLNKKKDYTIKYFKYGFDSSYIPEAQKNPANKFTKEVQLINGHEVIVYKGDFSANPFGDKHPMLGGKKLNFLEPKLNRDGIKADFDYRSAGVWDEELIKNAVLMQINGNSYMLIDYKKPFYVEDTFFKKRVLIAKVAHADSNGIRLNNGQYLNYSDCDVFDQSSLKGSDGTGYCVNFDVANLPKDLLVAVRENDNPESSRYDIFAYCIVK
ncbi:histidine kinase [Clostridium sporogenes]|uniref:hypothetical protein n=1 Tax=Clostridium TaxID=1485 RepID=UPI000580C870|nr:hypothetical protein [Clostridium sporogenes]AJD29202.1 putative sensor histidine kinase [Clostridium botulinum Prevot_594]NFL98583.1 histidine kinase [Clostridium botulinum]NFP56320.1 histidine kinase [Clostridium botulinum]NFQ18550.1 histidine kinase [Clostridium sporogenes]NFQ22486.1 histidine kinase [Clostridium sporogenes]